MCAARTASIAAFGIMDLVGTISSRHQHEAVIATASATQLARIGVDRFCRKFNTGSKTLSPAAVFERDGCGTRKSAHAAAGRARMIGTRVKNMNSPRM